MVLAEEAYRAIRCDGGAFALLLSGVAGVEPLADEREAQASSDVAAVLEANDALTRDAVAPSSRDADATVIVNQKVESVLDLADRGRVTMQSVDRPDEAIGLELEGAGDLEAMALDPMSGIAVFESPEEEFTYVPVLREDGSVQAHTVIETSSAPTRYDYAVEIPEGGRMDVVGSAVLILDAEGEMVGGGIAPAWAKDALGNEVPTRYEIDGTTLTQAVEHNSSFAYPVTADPWLGRNLFGHVFTDWTGGDMRVNARVSAWGLAVWAGVSTGGVAGGQVILNTAGWSEVRSRGADVRHALNKSSQRQQFECHALASGFTGNKADRWPTWNLEKFRPNRTAHWSYGVAIHRCNWATANRY